MRNEILNNFVIDRWMIVQQLRSGKRPFSKVAISYTYNITHLLKQIIRVPPYDFKIPIGCHVKFNMACYGKVKKWNQNDRSKIPIPTLMLKV
jgi:hypothetical protein